MFTAMLSVAALFVVFALLKPRAGCGGDCGMCVKACGTEKRGHHD